jgi:hypothetical protein
MPLLATFFQPVTWQISLAGNMYVTLVIQVATEGLSNSPARAAPATLWLATLLAKQ